MRTINIGPVTAEVLDTIVVDGEERTACATFPLTDDPTGTWGIVTMGHVDGSSWAVSLGQGWLYDKRGDLLDYPSIHAAVDALLAMGSKPKGKPRRKRRAR